MLIIATAIIDTANCINPCVIIVKHPSNLRKFQSGPKSLFELKVFYVNKRHITSSERRLGGQQWRLSCFWGESGGGAEVSPEVPLVTVDGGSEDFP